MKTKWTALAILSLLPMLPLQSRAVDGVLEINQTCATMTGCFPGDVAGFPVTIGAGGSYRLTGNLQLPGPDTDAVVITAGPVTLNLGGFALQGVTTCRGVPVSSCTPAGAGSGVVGLAGVSDIAVRNGSITGMGSGGVSLDFSARVEDLHVFHNGTDGLSLGNESLVSRNIVTSNGDNGILCGMHCLVRDNTSTGNRLDGIGVVSGTVIGNTASRNGTAGGSFGALTGYAGNTFEANTPLDVSGGHETGGNLCSDGSCTTHGQRRYYLSTTTTDGAGALTGCATGFHMASLWEVYNLSLLRYDTTLGATRADSGSGPPTAMEGWMRTGSTSSTLSSGVPGADNCTSWTSASASREGTWMSLTGAWSGTFSLPTNVSPWEGQTSTCDTLKAVWCVEN